MAEASGGRSGVRGLPSADRTAGVCQYGTFGEQLRNDRIAAGLTQGQLAERSALSVRAIGDLERGRISQPRTSTLRQLAEALSESADDKTAGPAGLPRQLPAPTSPFVGRSKELAALSFLSDQCFLSDQAAGETGATAVISAIGGTAGVGKTALALRWAHARASDFPDGQLYVNLRGYDPGPPVLPHDALASFLRALGVNGQDVPPGPGRVRGPVPEPDRRAADADPARQRQGRRASQAAAPSRFWLHGTGDQQGRARRADRPRRGAAPGPGPAGACRMRSRSFDR